MVCTKEADFRQNTKWQETAHWVTSFCHFFNIRIVFRRPVAKFYDDSNGLLNTHKISIDSQSVKLQVRVALKYQYLFSVGTKPSPAKQNVKYECFYCPFQIFHIFCGGVSGVGFTKPISVSFPLFSWFAITAKTLVTYWISRSYLTGVAAAQLRWHPSNTKVMKKRKRYFCKFKKFLNGDIYERILTRLHPWDGEISPQWSNIVNVACTPFIFCTMLFHIFQNMSY